MQATILGELIERAAKECGTKAELARQVGVTPQRLSEWASGRRQIPPEQIAIIADIAGLVAEEWAIRAMLLNSKDKPYFERLHKALGKWLPRTGVVILTFTVAATFGALFGRPAHAEPTFHNV